ncbi:hypothetical protein Dsin_012123 [Dipteronia sinensis]|uniref:Reverse transcriptase zinc-binding domain-containing protein n=1 Tax=Dipteronia sinensis TaxID=43782 RepID=A0AAE0E7M9_9ROSI|nr:hypothetical protein Dsin_012123 [Dipteronia sinensis]
MAKEIEKIQRTFLWGDGTAKRKLHWVRWEGGWVEDKSLWKRLISAKYGVMYSLSWNWKEAPNLSAFVKAVRSLFKEGSDTYGILNEGLKIVIGNGERASFWIDLWKDVQDSMAWIHSPDGQLSVGSLRRCLEGDRGNFLDDSRVLWAGICPPKIEVFAWQVLKGKIMVYEVLNRYGFNSAQSMDCSLCHSEVESINHLFLHCHWTWGIWQKCMKMWEVSYYPNASVVDWFISWSTLCPISKHGKVWNSIFFAVIWTVWESRNWVIFKDKIIDMDQAFDMIKFRMVWWFQYLGRGSRESVTLLLQDIKERCVETHGTKKAAHEVWTTPLLGSLKFNVDGSVRGYPSMAGICGVLRNNNGKVLCIFSKWIGIQDSNTAEILAIRKDVACVFPTLIIRTRRL